MSNSKRSRKNNSNRSSTQDSQRQSDHTRSRKRKYNQAHNSQTRCGDTVLSSSKLSKTVRGLIDSVFNGDNDLTKDLIEEPAVRLLEEVTENEALAAVGEFAERYKVARHKILRSKAGYFRGVCQKYWKQNREHKKLELLRKASINPSPNGKYTRTLSALVSETIESLFTPASGLAVSIIDDSVQRRLTSLTDEQAIEALHEFCSAVMYRQDRIRNMNAYLMNIIKRRTTRGQTKGEPDRKSSSDTPSLNKEPQGQRSPRPRGKPNHPPKNTRSPRSVHSSDQSYDEGLVMKRARSAGDPRRMGRRPPPPHNPSLLTHDDPRHMIHKSNPIVASFGAMQREDSAEAPQWNLAQSAPFQLGRRHDPQMQCVFSEQLTYGKSAAPPRRMSPLGNSAPSAEFLGYASDDDESNGMVFTGDYDDGEEEAPSWSDEHSYSEDHSSSHQPDMMVQPKPQLSGQRPSNGPPPNRNVPRIMARNSKPVPAMRDPTRENEYKREIKKLQRENDSLREQMQQLQEQVRQLSYRQNQLVFEQPPINPVPYHPQMYAGGFTPPASSSNLSMTGRSPQLLPTSAGNQSDTYQAFPTANFVPNMPFPSPGLQPQFMGFMQPGIPSNPNAMFTNLSQPNAIGQPQFLPPYTHPHPHPQFVGHH